MAAYLTPGVYLVDVFTKPAAELWTGVPVFVGLASEQDMEALRLHVIQLAWRTTLSLVKAPREGETTGAQIASVRSSLVSDPSASMRPMYLESDLAPGTKDWKLTGEGLRKLLQEPGMFTLWPTVEAELAPLFESGYLGYAVRGFFENGGRLCFVYIIPYGGQSGKTRFEALDAGLEALDAFDDFDLICVPDLMWSPGGMSPADRDEIVAAQAKVLQHCANMGNRFAILDALPELTSTARVRMTASRLVDDLDSDATASGALYYPWIKVASSPGLTGRYVPPCGHVAGVYARSDLLHGVHKAPANEVVEGVLDLEVHLTNQSQGPLNQQGINCLRAFPTRGIRVWGARTLSSDGAWTYVNVRRLLVTISRWLEHNMAGVVFEPHSPELWARIVREVTAYLDDLFRQGAFTGRIAEEAFFVRCDAALNPQEVRDAGMVVAEIGLALATPTEFIIVRILHGPTGVRILRPT